MEEFRLKERRVCPGTDCRVQTLDCRPHRALVDGIWLSCSMLVEASKHAYALLTSRQVRTLAMVAMVAMVATFSRQPKEQKAEAGATVGAKGAKSAKMAGTTQARCATPFCRST